MKTKDSIGEAPQPPQNILHKCSCGCGCPQCAERERVLKAMTAAPAAPQNKKPNGFLTDFLKSLVSASDPETLRSVAMDAAIRKAATDGAEGDNGDVRILDQEIGDMRDVVPPAGQVVMGPAQAATGGNAERQIGEYSRPDPQQDIVARYEQLSRELGSLRGYMKSMAEAVASMVARKAEEEEKKEEEAAKAAEAAAAAKAEEDESEEEREEEAKSLPQSYRDLVSELAASMIRKAEDEEEDEEEHEAAKAEDDREEEDEESAKSINPYTRIYLARATWLAAQAALAKATPKMRKSARKRLDKGVEDAIRKAWSLLKKAEDEEKKDEEETEAKKALRRSIKKASQQIAEYAYLRDISLKAPKPTHKAREQAEGDLGKEIPSNNQTKWPADPSASPGPVMKTELEKVLAGQAMLNSSVQGLLKIVAGTSRPQDLPVIELPKSIEAAATTPVAPPSVLALTKGGDANSWLIAKSKAIQEVCNREGFTSLSEELAAGSVLAMAQAVHEGAVGLDVLQARVRSCEGVVREIFSDVLEGTA